MKGNNHNCPQRPEKVTKLDDTAFIDGPNDRLPHVSARSPSISWDRTHKATSTIINEIVRRSLPFFSVSRLRLCLCCCVSLPPAGLLCGMPRLLNIAIGALTTTHGTPPRKAVERLTSILPLPRARRDRDRPHRTQHDSQCRENAWGASSSRFVEDSSGPISLKSCPWSLVASRFRIGECPAATGQGGAEV